MADLFQSNWSSPTVNEAKNEEDETWRMDHTLYKEEELSSTSDSSRYAIGNNSLNKWYRFSAYSGVDVDTYNDLFSWSSVRWISDEITKRLTGVHPEGKKIVVPDKVILSVADGFFNKLHIDVSRIREQIVMYICQIIRDEFQTVKQNDALNVWVQLMTPDTTMRKFNDYKMNEKRGTHWYAWNY